MISITSIKDTPTPDPAVLFGLELAKKLRSTSKCVKAHQVVMRAVVERQMKQDLKANGTALNNTVPQN